MTTYKLHWLTGQTELVEGSSIADAFTQAGYGNGALKALDYYEDTSKVVNKYTLSWAVFGYRQESDIVKAYSREEALHIAKEEALTLYELKYGTPTQAGVTKIDAYIKHRDDNMYFDVTDV